MSQPVRLATLLLLIAFPILEIGLLIRAGQALGFWRLALIVIATAVLGTIVIRRIGVTVLQKMMARAETGRDSMEPVFDGLLQGIAGMLLILPGFISDGLGTLLLIPALRRFLINSGLPRLLASSFVRAEVFDERFETGHSRQDPGRGGPGYDDRQPGDAPGVIIEGEYERLNEEPAKPRRPQPPRAPKA